MITNPKNRQRAFDVYLNGKWIDTVFYSALISIDLAEVKQSLVNHDVYHPGIIVREVTK